MTQPVVSPLVAPVQGAPTTPAQASPQAPGESIVLDDARARAFMTGAVGLPAGARVHVNIGGRLGTVPAEELQQTLERPDARPASAKEVHDAAIQRKFGDSVGMLQAGGAGLARGLTAGLSDPLIVGAASALGGEAAAKHARETLAGIQEANPWTSGISETVGAVAPLAVGDVGGLAGEGVRGAGAISRGIAGLGELAGTGAEHLVGGGATSFLGRLAQSAVREGANVGAQTALYNVGQEISESALGDTDLNGEKLWMAAGHGFLLGATGGGLLAGTGALGREVLGRAAPKIAELAETQAWRTISGRKAFQTLADKIPGGERGIGRTLLDGGILQAGQRVEDVAPKVAAARAKAGEDIGALLDAADQSGLAAPSTANVRAEVEKGAIADLEKMGRTNSGAVKKVRDVLADLEDLAPVRAVVPDATRARLGTQLDELVARASKPGGEEAKQVLEGMGVSWERAPMTFRGMQDFRARLDEQIKWSSNPLAPVNETTEALKAVRAAIEGEITSAGDKASEVLGRSWREQYEAAKVKYRQLTIADRAAADAVDRFRANRAISPTDYLVGAGSMAGSLGVEGMLSGGLHGLAAGAAHKIVRERGNATAAVLLDKLAAMGGVQSALRRMDQQIARGVENAIASGSRMRPKFREAPFGKEESSHEERVSAVTRAAARADEHADRLADAVAPIAPHAPAIAASFQRSALRATSMLASSLPKGTRPTPSLTPQFDRVTSTAAERAEFDRASHLTHDPVGYVFDRIDSGTLTQADVGAMQKLAPKTYEQMASAMRIKLLDVQKRIDRNRMLQLETFLGVPDPGLQVGQLLGTQPPPSPPPGPPGGTRGKTGAPVRQLKLAGAVGLQGSKVMSK